MREYFSQIPSFELRNHCFVDLVHVDRELTDMVVCGAKIFSLSEDGEIVTSECDSSRKPYHLMRNQDHLKIYKFKLFETQDKTQNIISSTLGPCFEI